MKWGGPKNMLIQALECKFGRHARTQQHTLHECAVLMIEGNTKLESCASLTS